MKKVLTSGLVTITFFLVTGFKPSPSFTFGLLPMRPISANYDMRWSEWQSMPSNQIRMRWGVDEFGEVSRQFRNDYTFEVHFWFRIDCTDGKSYSGNDIVDAGSLTNSADQMKSKPSSWTILAKKKRVNGMWVEF